MARPRPATDRGPTPLQRQLAGHSEARRRTGLDAFLAARRSFLARRAGGHERTGRAGGGEPRLSRFLADEGELAMRLLTWTEMGFQPRLLADCQGMLEQEFARGTLDLAPELHQDVAHTVLRIVESYV